MTTTTETRRTTKCDKQGCNDDAAWAYTVVTLYGVETWNSCQGHVREVREMHGQNIQNVRPVR